MAENKETLEARRMFRQRLADLAREYPQLTTPAAQERLAEALDTRTEEEITCRNYPPGTPEADQKVPGN